MTDKVAVALLFLVFGLYFSLFARTIDEQNGDYYKDARWYIFAYRSHPVNVYLFRVVGIVLAVTSIAIFLSLLRG